MLSDTEFMQQSAGLHLFSARNMKENCLFLQAGFPPKHANLALRANQFKVKFENFMAEVVLGANGFVHNEQMLSNELVTAFTMDSEQATQDLTGIQIPLHITRTVLNLKPSKGNYPTAAQRNRFMMLNQQAVDLIETLVGFLERVVGDIRSAKAFNMNCLFTIRHFKTEAKLYMVLLRQLQKNESIKKVMTAAEEEAFWNRCMSEHAKILRGSIDPSEKQWVQAANYLGNLFDDIDVNIEESMKATQQLYDFITELMQGILQGEVQSVLLPLHGDHMLREANHYLRLLENTIGEP